MILFHQGCLRGIIACLKALTQSSHVNCQDNSTILCSTELNVLCLASSVLLMKIFPFSPRVLQTVELWLCLPDLQTCNDCQSIGNVLILKWTASHQHRCVLAVLLLSSSISHMREVSHEGRYLELSKIVYVLCLNFTSQKIQKCKTKGGCPAGPGHESG